MAYIVEKTPAKTLGRWNNETEEWEETTLREVWTVLYQAENGEKREIDGRCSYYTKQAAYRRCRNLNKA